MEGEIYIFSCRGEFNYFVRIFEKKDVKACNKYVRFPLDKYMYLHTRNNNYRVSITLK